MMKINILEYDHKGICKLTGYCTETFKSMNKLAPIVQRVGCGVHWINCHLIGNYINIKKSMKLLTQRMYFGG